MDIPGKDKLDQLAALVLSAAPADLGDVFAEAVKIRITISNPIALSLSELPMRQ